MNVESLLRQWQRSVDLTLRSFFKTTVCGNPTVSRCYVESELGTSLWPTLLQWSPHPRDCSAAGQHTSKHLPGVFLWRSMSLISRRDPLKISEAVTLSDGPPPKTPSIWDHTTTVKKKGVMENNKTGGDRDAHMREELDERVKGKHAAHVPAAFCLTKWPTLGDIFGYL